MTYLSYLTFLDLAVNRLSGNIPSNIGELSNLFYLNLSTNALTGQIPEALGAITPLQSVDLSSNLLDGPIPQDFGSLKRLDIFMVGNNNLSGPIPTGPQMQTFTSDSYLPGNDNLCGNPLTRICASNSSNSESGFKTLPKTLL
jgi:leucine-rich repeat protein SHOC2